MARVRFSDIAKRIGEEVLAPLGFASLRVLDMLVFARKRRDSLFDCVSFYTHRDGESFTVELGVTRDPKDFGMANFTEDGAWQRFGLRERLGVLVHGSPPDLRSSDRDFFPYVDRESATRQVRRALDLVLSVGPGAWDRFASRLAGTPL